MRASRLLFLAAAGSVACSTTNSNAAPAPTDVAAIGRSIDSLDANGMRWSNAGAADSMANGYYTQDAIVMMPNAPVAKGHDAIVAAWKGLSTAGVLRLHFQRATMIVSDSVVSDQGTYTLEVRAKPPADTTKVLATDHGNYVTTFVRRDGQWRSLYDIATSEVPAPKQ